MPRNAACIRTLQTSPKEKTSSKPKSSLKLNGKQNPEHDCKIHHPIATGSSGLMCLAELEPGQYTKYVTRAGPDLTRAKMLKRRPGDPLHALVPGIPSQSASRICPFDGNLE